MPGKKPATKKVARSISEMKPSAHAGSPSPALPLSELGRIADLFHSRESTKQPSRVKKRAPGRDGEKHAERRAERRVDTPVAPERAAKVEEIRQKIRSGYYRSAQAMREIADKLADELTEPKTRKGKDKHE